MLGRKLFILPMTAEIPSSFEEVYLVEDLNAAKQAFDLPQVFLRAVARNGHFDLTQAIDLAQRAPNMTVAASIDQTLVQTHDRLEEIVNRVNLLFDNLLDIALPQKHQARMHRAISYAFTNLNTQTTDSWIAYEKKSADSITYQYNILFAVQSVSTGEFVYGVPMGITIRVDREYERVLFITTQNKVSYVVRVEALKVIQPLESYINQVKLFY